MKMTTVHWQIISLISKLAAILLGLVANIVVLRIISPEEWGIISLALSMVGSVSVFHHLGIPSGLNREIARSENQKEAGTIIISALTMRLPVSVLIGGGVFFSASYIAHTVYAQPELLFPLQLFGISVVIDGFQDILSTSVGALKLFKKLFVFQVVLSVINVVALIAGVYIWGFIGFIYAKYVYTGASLVIYGFVLVRYLKNNTVHFAQMWIYIKNIFGIGVAAFIQKIAFLYWQKIPTILMGKIVVIGDIGLYGFVDYFTQRLSIFSDAATDVSVPVFMRSFTHDYSKFVGEFIQNFWRVAGITVLFLVFGTLFFEEFLIITGLTKYEHTQSLFMVMGSAMLFVSLINTIGVVFIAGNNRKHMIAAYAGMFVVTAFGVIPLTNMWGVLGGAVAFASGSLFGLVYYLIQLWRVYAIQLFTKKYEIVLIPLALLFFYSSDLLLRIFVSSAFFVLASIYGYMQYKMSLQRAWLRFRSTYKK